jgi:hypothetical protein
VRFPSADDHWPSHVSNTVPVQLSLGAYNATQQSDLHSYWEFNQYTDWAPPTYEIPFTGGLPGTLEAGQIGARSSLIPGSGPSGVAVAFTTGRDRAGGASRLVTVRTGYSPAGSCCQRRERARWLGGAG